MNKSALQLKLMDISLNLGRMGNFAADDYKNKKALINMFLNQTQDYLNELNTFSMPIDIKEPVEKFSKEFYVMKNRKISENESDAWAEKALTWANIFQHRSSLA